MKGQTNNFVLKNRLQKMLRRNMTDAEQALWKRLRGCQVKGRKFRRQHPFGYFILDFVCLEAKLVVEIDGGQHNGSAQDLVRDQVLGRAGFRVMRFWNNQVLNEMESVVESIWLALEPHPHPNPPLEGEGANVRSIYRPHPHRTHPHPNLPPEGEGTIAPPLSRGRASARGQLGGGWVDSPPLEGEGANAGSIHRPHPNPPLEGEGANSE